MSRRAEKHLKLTLPQGCKEISEDLSNDELVKRLKVRQLRENCTEKRLEVSVWKKLN